MNFLFLALIGYETMITADVYLLDKGQVVSSIHYSTPKVDTKVTVPNPLGFGWRCMISQPKLSKDGKWSAFLSCSSWNGAFKVSNSVSCSASSSDEDFHVTTLVSENNPELVADVSIMCSTFKSLPRKLDLNNPYL